MSRASGRALAGTAGQNPKRRVNLNVRPSFKVLLIWPKLGEVKSSLQAPHVVVLWIIAGMLAGLGALHRPAMEALMQQVLPVSEVMAAGALNSVRGNFAFVVGPGVAGIIAATGGASAAFSFRAS